MGASTRSNNFHRSADSPARGACSPRATSACREMAPHTASAPLEGTPPALGWAHCLTHRELCRARVPDQSRNPMLVIVMGRWSSGPPAVERLGTRAISPSVRASGQGCPVSTSS